MGLIKVIGTDPNGSSKIIAQTDLLNAQNVAILLDTDVIGALNELVALPYSLGANKVLAHLNTGYYHIHGTSFVYPDHADAITLTAGAGAWDLTGAIIEVVPAGALSVADFDLHWISISGISGNGELQVDIFKGAIGAEILIGSTDAYRNAVQSQEGAKRIQVPQQEEDTRISCRLSDSTGGALTCNVKFNGHYYAG